MPVSKVCQHCQKTFSVENGRANTAKYCCNECYWQGKRNRVETTCETCGKSFSAFPSNLKRNKDKYCSTECQYVGTRKRIEKTCPVCLKHFEIHPHQERRGKGVFCSNACFRIHKTTKVEVICENCNQPYMVILSCVERSRFCSRSCQGAWKARQNYTQTDIERILEQLLISLNVEFRCQESIGSYLCDFYVPSSNLVIEADGIYWHSLPANIARDKRKNTYLKNENYNLLRLPGDKIRNDPAWCKEQIINHLQSTDAQNNGNEDGQAVRQMRFWLD